MKQRTFVGVASSIFFLVGLVHLIRLFARWDFMLGDWFAPFWVSLIAVAIAWYLAFTGLNMLTK